ncbi:MAG: electron transport complex subunit RsxC [Candidatus Omnitrophota bacterium]|nr:electron transport complex subunit RsxC [Candidatus Omnitrophota bacterium]
MMFRTFTPLETLKRALGKTKFLTGFTGGIHPPERKEYTRDKGIRQASPPERIVIPMIQHTGAPCKPLVKSGDSVKKGQVVGQAEEFITSPVHASISGTVKEIKEMPHPTAGKSVSIVIESDGKDEWIKPVMARHDVSHLKKQDITDIIKQNGIVGLGGAAFPSHVKLMPRRKTIDTVILNGAECEPYLTCDERIMIERPRDMIKGLLLIMTAVDAGLAFIAIESNKPEAIEAVRNSLKNFKAEESGGKDIKLKVLPVKYPQGSEKQLIETILKRRVPPKGLPLDVGCVVYNAGTAVAIFEAVYSGKPLIERCVTITGDCLREPMNLNVRIGTLVKDIINECGGIIRDISKALVGGPMMGIAQCTMDIPVIKGMTGILFLSDDEARIFDEETCIRCARCVDACPMNLLPLSYAKLVKKEKFDALKNYNIEDCMECGACAYVCPSRIPLVQYIKAGKRELFYGKEKA